MINCHNYVAIGHLSFIYLFLLLFFIRHAVHKKKWNCVSYMQSRGRKCRKTARKLLCGHHKINKNYEMKNGRNLTL